MNNKTHEYHLERVLVSMGNMPGYIYTKPIGKRALLQGEQNEKVCEPFPSVIYEVGSAAVPRNRKR